MQLGRGVQLTGTSSAMPILIAASHLIRSDALSHIGVPCGPGCFHPKRKLLSILVQKAKDTSKPLRINKIFFRINHWRTCLSFRNPVDPETKYCRLNLDMIMKHILEQTKVSGVTILSDSSVSVQFNFVFCKITSLPEPCLLYDVGAGNYMGLIGSEAKSVSDSIRVAYPQAVAIASDFALELERHGIRYDSIVVPFVMTASEDVQVGAVYLMDQNYPCPVLLSRKLSFTCREDVQEMARWIVALANHAKKMIKLLVKTASTALANRAAVKYPTINLDRFVLKAVPLNDLKDSYAQCWLVNLMYRFNKLWQNEQCREVVVFPEGIMGYPDPVTQECFQKLVLEQLSSLYEKNLMPPPSPYYPPGWPIILYEKLHPDKWIRADALSRDIRLICRVPKKISEAVTHSLRVKFVAALEKAVEGFRAAGIVHTDLRLHNIFYTCCNDDEVENGGCVRIKVIDWDDCVLEGDQLETSFYNLVVSGNDGRYPRHQAETPVTSDLYHDFFLKFIKKDLGLV